MKEVIHNFSRRAVNNSNFAEWAKGILHGYCHFGGPDRDDCNDLSPPLTKAEDFELTVTRSGSVTTVTTSQRMASQRPLNIAVARL